ncbi:MAG: PD-(D/E)XK nuclease family protein [Nanoarchaeota archaeon]
MPFKLSPSALNLMKECPRCFWLTQHKVWKRPSGVFPSLPSGMDAILKTHFNKFMDKKQLPPELCNNGDCKNIKLFDNHELLAIWRSNFKGLTYKDKQGNILKGAVDNILMKGKKLIVLDYKTRGFPLKEDTHEHYQNQLDIYNFLLRKNGYTTEDYAFLLFYVPKEVLPKGEIIFDTTLKKMKIDVKNAEIIFNKAIKLLNSNCPTKFCEWCDNS